MLKERCPVVDHHAGRHHKGQLVTVYLGDSVDFVDFLLWPFAALEESGFCVRSVKAIEVNQAGNEITEAYLPRYKFSDALRLRLRLLAAFHAVMMRLQLQ